MANKTIMLDIVVNKIKLKVDAFNKKNMSKKDCVYVPKIKGKFVYLMRTLYDGSLEHVCRLKYTGDINNMEFAIYKYSTESYDPNEWNFNGASLVDGTLEKAMKAGLEAYPI
jgi:hypothetical protein